VCGLCTLLRRVGGDMVNVLAQLSVQCHRYPVLRVSLGASACMCQGIRRQCICGDTVCTPILHVWILNR
jgi:hypothetical protein